MYVYIYVDFTVDYMRRTGFRTPIRMKEREYLGLKVPDSTFTVSDVGCVVCLCGTPVHVCESTCFCVPMHSDVSVHMHVQGACGHDTQSGCHGLRDPGSADNVALR